MRKTLLTQSISTKLSPSQYEAFEARALAQGVKVSEYARQILLASMQKPNNNNQVETRLALLLEEVLALRSIVLNLAGEQASGVPLTAERMQAVRTHADASKAARAQGLLTGKTSNKGKLAVVNESEEAA
jgi:hypothetical protein